MPGPIRTAKTAYNVHSDDFGSMKRKGDKVLLKNSSGKPVWVDEDDPVYHRGRGNFGLYDTDRDAARHSRRSKDYVGTGRYRHTDDKKRSRR